MLEDVGRMLEGVLEGVLEGPGRMLEGCWKPGLAAAVVSLEHAQLTRSLTKQGWRGSGFVGSGIERACWRGCRCLRARLRRGAGAGAGVSMADLGGVTGNLGAALAGQFGNSCFALHAAPPRGTFDVARQWRSRLLPFLLATLLAGICAAGSRATISCNPSAPKRGPMSSSPTFCERGRRVRWRRVAGTYERLGVERGAAHADLLAMVGGNAAKVGVGSCGAEHICGVDWRDTKGAV